MSGHSKWATIKHKKAALDAKRGKSFTRIIKEIMIAARSGGDPDMNPRLRTAIVAAKAVSMPADNIKKAIMRGTGELEGGQIEEVMFEGYGPGGAAVLVDCLTDDRNRTVADVRRTFARFGGLLGADGAVAYLFNPVGLLAYPPGTDNRRLLAAAIAAGAEDVLVNPDGSAEVLTDPVELERVRGSLAAGGLAPTAFAMTRRAAHATELAGETAEAMMRLLDSLEDLDDVQNVYSNAEIPYEVLARV